MPPAKQKHRMPEQPASVRVTNFGEVALGYTEEMALAEATRCLKCKNEPCVTGCPVNVPIRDFIALIREGDFLGALLKIKETNALPAVCGRVCPQESQCERLCTLAKIKGSEPVAIGRLERFVADYVREHHPEIRPSPVEIPEEVRNRRSQQPVAIIGSGPAGLTCASDLAVLGFPVTIFEAFHVAGGVLVYGIPEFRLPKAIVQQEIDNLESLGVKIELNRVVGKTLDLQDVWDLGFKAAFIGVGAGLPSFMRIPGENLNGVLSSSEFLTRVNLMKGYREDFITPVAIGQYVAVVGGGNVAMDAARTSLRLGARRVMIVYRRSEDELPARAEEYHHAREEGVEFHFLRNPKEILGDQSGFVQAIKLQVMELGEPDASGRRSPVEVPGAEEEFEVDTVIMSIGQKANPLLTQSTSGLETNRWGYIQADSDTLATSIPGVYAGGDIVTGAATVISAMGAGKRAAAGIVAYLDALP
jgi:glutamate synthase (NADPH/NADH) small chain